MTVILFLLKYLFFLVQNLIFFMKRSKKSEEDLSKKQVNASNSQKRKNLNNRNGEMIGKDTRNDNLKFADAKHRSCSGVDNWKKFLESQGMSLKVNIFSQKENAYLKGRAASNRITKFIGMDCEMVGIGDRGEENMLARVSLVNNYGDCIYDKYVKPLVKVTDYRTSVSGIRPEDLVNAEDFSVVQKEVAEILKGKILVGHALKNDLDVLFLQHPKYNIRDTSKFFCKKNKKTPSLKSLTKEYLNVTIQDGEHSSVVDARAAMHLYNLYRKSWEAGKGNKSRRRIDECGVPGEKSFAATIKNGLDL